MVDLVANRFELHEAVGRGGSGTVFRARDRATGQTVAVKLVDPAVQGRARFAREAAALAALTAPGIVRYIDHGEHGDRLYLVEEWLDGGSLRARLLGDGVTAAEAIQIVRGAAQGLAHAHAAGIVHRDIKPDHVWLTGDRVTLIDFGIARATRDPRVTTTGRAIGTPAYMAPEQARGDTTIDARADVFALGAVLYEALTGIVAFAGRSDGAIRAKVVLVDPPALAARCPEAPLALLSLVHAMLQKDPALRPRDGAAVAAALAAIVIDDGPRRRSTSAEATTTTISATPRALPIADGSAPHPRPTGFVLAAGPVTAAPDHLGALAGAAVALVEGGLWLSVLADATAHRAADIATAWHAALGAPVAVAAITDGVDAAVDHAADALERAALLAEFHDFTGATASVLLDPVTTALLGRTAVGA